MQRTRARTAHRRRRGVALLTALALLTLAAALLAGSFASATALVHQERSARASAYVEAVARRATAEALASWNEGESLPVSAYVDREPVEDTPLGRATVRMRTQRISTRLYTITVSVRLGEGTTPLAARRLRLVVERTQESDGAGSSAAPTPIARWSVAGIY